MHYSLNDSYLEDITENLTHVTAWNELVSMGLRNRNFFTTWCLMI